MVNFPIWIPDCDSHSPALLDLFFPSDASICSAMTFLHSEILILLSQFPLNFSHTQNWMPHFIAQLTTILTEMFHGRISLNSALLFRLVNFVSWLRLKLMYISLMVSISSSLTHLHGFQLLVQSIVHRNPFFIYLFFNINIF